MGGKDPYHSYLMPTIFSYGRAVDMDNIRVNRKNSVLLLVPKSDPKCYK
jgi:hypothetical protein